MLGGTVGPPLRPTIGLDPLMPGGPLHDAPLDGAGSLEIEERWSDPFLQDKDLLPKGLL